MGGESSPEVFFQAVRMAAEYIGPTHSFLLFSNPETYAAVQCAHAEMSQDPSLARVEFSLVPDFITMRDDPLPAVRAKKNSSLVQGIRALKKKHADPQRIDAFVSAGNTGALVVAATLGLPRLQGVRRPALLALLPTEVGHMAVLDVGGNVQLKGDHLVRFAELGACFKRVQEGLATPRVGLLNVGVESKKGTIEHRRAYEALQNLAKTHPGFKFIGNIEGRDVFRGLVDVLITDGFTGNILLKTTEGMAFFMLDFLKKNVQSSHSIDVQNLLQAFLKQFSYAEYPGAILLGVEGIVVKCHGDSNAKSILNGIKAAFSYAENGLIDRLRKDLSGFSLAGFSPPR